MKSASIAAVTLATVLSVSNFIFTSFLPEMQDIDHRVLAESVFVHPVKAIEATPQDQEKIVIPTSNPIRSIADSNHSTVEESDGKFGMENPAPAQVSGGNIHLNEFPVAVTHNPKLKWRKGAFTEAHSNVTGYLFSWFLHAEIQVGGFNCSLAMSVYGRCPTGSEVSHLAGHQQAWSWLSSLPHEYGIVLEDSASIKPFTSRFSSEFATHEYDIVSLYVLEQHSLHALNLSINSTGLISRCECISTSPAYILSKKASTLLSQDKGQVSGGVLDHMCYLVKKFGLKVGKANVDFFMEKRLDYEFDVRDWMFRQRGGYHCQPNLAKKETSLPVKIFLLRALDFVLAYKAKMNRLAADIGSRLGYVFLHNLENQDVERVLNPQTFRMVNAIFSHRDWRNPVQVAVPGPEWFSMSYVLGYEEHYRRSGLGISRQSRSDELAYWISQCVSKLNRLALIEEVSQHMPTNSLAKCTTPSSIKASSFVGCPKSSHGELGYNAEKICAYSRSTFALAFENSKAPRYITEKLWLPLIVGSIPIYIGAPDVKEWLPAPEAAIIISDFPNVSSAMDYVKLVRDNITLWEYHQAWRSRPFSLKFLHLLRTSVPSLFCNLDIVNLV